MDANNEAFELAILEHLGPAALIAESLSTFGIFRLGWEAALAQPAQGEALFRACNLAGVDFETALRIAEYLPVMPPQPPADTIAVPRSELDRLRKISTKLLTIFDHPTRSVTIFDADELRCALAAVAKSTGGDV